MSELIISGDMLDTFRQSLIEEEKSMVTVDKYLRDIRRFIFFAEGKAITKNLTLEYKRHLQSQSYSVRSINSMIASLNKFLVFLGLSDCKIKSLRCQRQIYCAEEKELSREEYFRLLNASASQPRLNLILQTICGTGIRISELQYFTVENIRQGEVWVKCKNKTRKILIPGRLKKQLLNYAKKSRIYSGAIFVSRSGKPLDRSNIWTQMKKLCKAAKVQPSKVFPHNLRKLFARTFYAIDKDIAKLADILGHSSIDVTRIYIMSSGLEHRRIIEGLRLVT